MTTPISTAYVDIVADTQNFAADLQRAIRTAMAGATSTVNNATRNINTSLTGISTSAETTSRRSGAAFKRMALAASGAFAGVQLGRVFKGFVESAQESARVARLTENVIRSTGGAAKVTADQVGDLADAISVKTGVDDGTIQSGQNLLLTFGAVRDEVGKGNAIFSLASIAAVDMAAALNEGAVSAGGIKGATIQLGKALQDPVKGLAALSRSGVSFTAGQKAQIKEMVKAGDVLGAQKRILAEIGKEFGGAAAAAADPMSRLRTITGNLGESIGTALLPVIDSFATKLGGLIQGFRDGEGAGGALRATFAGVGDYLRDVFGPSVATLRDRFAEAGPGLQELMTGFSEMGVTVLPVLSNAILIAADVAGRLALALASIGGFVNDHSELLGGFAVVLGTVATAIWAVAAAQAAWTVATGILTGATWSLNAALWATGIPEIVVGIAALAAGLIYAWQHSETFRDIVVKVFNTVKDVVLTAVQVMLRVWTGWLTAILYGVKGIASAWTHLPGFLGGGDNGWASKVAGAADFVLDQLSNIQSGIDDLKGKDLDINVRIKPMVVMPSDEGNRGRARDAATPDLPVVPKIPIPKFPSFPSGGGGGGGGGDTSAADAAKDRAKALRAVGKQVAAKGFVNAVTGGEDAIRAAFDKLLANLKAGDKKTLLAYAKGIRSSLLDLAGDKDALRATFHGVKFNLADLKAKLVDLRTESKDFAASVKSAVVDTGSVAEGPKGIATTFTGIRNNLREAIRTTTAFATAIKTLQTLKLNPESLGQLIAAGPEAGLAAAQAIARQGAKGVTEINTLEKQLEASGGALGTSVAGTFFTAGIKVAEGLVAGLKSKEAALDAQMTRLADRMVAHLKKALGIQSPSAVFFRAGMQIPAGLAGGVRAGTPAASAAAAAMGTSVTFAAGAVQVNGVSDPERARMAGILAGHGVADVLARHREIAALAGVGG